MRRTVFALLVLLVLSSGVMAQNIFLGPYVLLKVGVNGASTPQGSKSSINFNGTPDLGITAKWMFDRYSALGVVGDVGYSTYSFRIGPDNANEATNASTIIFKPSYFTIVPSIYLSGFTLGVAFGIPVAYSVQSAKGDDMSALFLADTRDLTSPLIELRVGGMIPVVKSETGTLSILIQGGYMVTGMVNGTYWPKYRFMFKDDGNNPKVISLGVGVNYLFNLSDL